MNEHNHLLNNLERGGMARRKYLFGDIEQIMEDLQREYEKEAKLAMTQAAIFATYQRNQEMTDISLAEHW
jgi:hypothetical protein